MGIEGENKVTQVLKSKLDDGYYLVNDVLYINARARSNGRTAIETPNISRNSAYSFVNSCEPIFLSS